MTLFGFLIFAIIVGVLLWLVVTYIPMPQPVKALIVAATCILLLIYLATIVGVMDWPLVRHRAVVR